MNAEPDDCASPARPPYRSGRKPARMGVVFEGFVQDGQFAQEHSWLFCHR